MHRGQLALEAAEEAWVERQAVRRRALQWYLRGRNRQRRAQTCYEVDGSLMMASLLDQLAGEAFRSMRYELSRLDALYEKARAFEIKARIAFEEGEERMASAPDSEWDWVARHTFTTLK
jgi:hypothetical protein